MQWIHEVVYLGRPTERGEIVLINTKIDLSILHWFLLIFISKFFKVPCAIHIMSTGPCGLFTTLPINILGKEEMLPTIGIPPKSYFMCILHPHTFHTSFNKMMRSGVLKLTLFHDNLRILIKFQIHQIYSLFLFFRIWIFTVRYHKRLWSRSQKVLFYPFHADKGAGGSRGKLREYEEACSIRIKRAFYYYRHFLGGGSSCIFYSWVLTLVIKKVINHGRLPLTSRK